MGLFGGGNVSSKNSVSTQNYNATTTPQTDLSGSTAGSAAVVTPTVLGGGSVGAINTTSSSFFAPVNYTPSVNYGDAAVKAAQQTAQTALQSTSASQQAQVTSSNSPSWFTALFSAPDIYYLLGALVLLMIYRGHHLK